MTRAELKRRHDARTNDAATLLEERAAQDVADAIEQPGDPATFAQRILNIDFAYLQDGGTLTDLATGKRYRLIETD